MGPLTRGHAAVAASSQREGDLGSHSLVLARREMPSRGLCVLRRSLGSQRGAARGHLVEGLAGGSFFPWGKGFTSRFLSSNVLRILGLRPFLCYSHFFRLKRPLEQAQPSMANKLKVGAVPKDSGEWFFPFSGIGAEWFLHRAS